MTSLKIREIPKDDETGRIMHDQMTDEFQTRYVYIGEDYTCMPIHYAKFAEDIENFEVRNSDVWICSYPKTGTTWAQEMVWMIENNVDFEGAKASIIARSTFLEMCAMSDNEKFEKIMGIPSPFHNTIQYANEQKSPRCIKSHLPFSLLPQELRSGTKAPKIIYVMRNPKDACVSYYHHCRLLHGCRASLEEFSKVFLADKVMYGSYWKHVLGFWEQRKLPNLLIIKYEDMKKDLAVVIKQVATFLDKQLTDRQIEELLKHLSFESMKNNKAVNVEDLIQLRKKKNLTIGDGSFIRSGTVGKYKEEMSAETIKKFGDWIKKNTEGTSFGEQYSNL